MILLLTIAYLIISIFTACLFVKIDLLLEGEFFLLGIYGICWIITIPLYLIGFIGTKITKLLKTKYQ